MTIKSHLSTTTNSPQRISSKKNWFNSRSAAYETQSLEILDIFIEVYCQATQRNQQDRLLQTIKKGVGARFDDWTTQEHHVATMITS